MDAATSSGATSAGRLMLPILRMLRGVYFLRSKVIFFKNKRMTLPICKTVLRGGGRKVILIKCRINAK